MEPYSLTTSSVGRWRRLQLICHPWLHHLWEAGDGYTWFVILDYIICGKLAMPTADFSSFSSVGSWRWLQLISHPWLHHLWEAGDGYSWFVILDYIICGKLVMATADLSSLTTSFVRSWRSYSWFVILDYIICGKLAMATADFSSFCLLYVFFPSYLHKAKTATFIHRPMMVSCW